VLDATNLFSEVGFVPSKVYQIEQPLQIFVIFIVPPPKTKRGLGIANSKVGIPKSFESFVSGIDSSSVVFVSSTTSSKQSVPTELSSEL